MGIVINLARIGPPRFGLTAIQWQRVCELAAGYHPGIDWPAGSAPDPREANGRLCFYRWLYQNGKVID